MCFSMCWDLIKSPQGENLKQMHILDFETQVNVGDPIWSFTFADKDKYKNVYKIFIVDSFV